MKIGRKPKTDAAPAGKKLNYALLSKTLRSFIRDAALIKKETPLSVKIFQDKTEGQIAHYPPDILDRLDKDELLKPVLEQCLTATIITLAQRTDFCSALVLKILVDRAGRGDKNAPVALEKIFADSARRKGLEAAIGLEHWVHGWQKEYVELLANKELLAPILKDLSGLAVIDLAKRVLTSLSYDKKDLSGPRDQIVVRLQELARGGYKPAKDYLLIESSQWDEDYIGHLAGFSVLDFSEPIVPAARPVFSNLREAVLAVTGEKDIDPIISPLDNLSLNDRKRP
ncbi:MAG: hypothetical protein PHG97_06165 [Candidatus Margulisbacteria bacterium]|nr:hypothetical protein [Candidatus Margulisiibacteriota bacterium]